MAVEIISIFHTNHAPSLCGGNLAPNLHSHFIVGVHFTSLFTSLYFTKRCFLSFYSEYRHKQKITESLILSAFGLVP